MSQEASDILRGQQHLNRHLFQKKIADAAEAQSEQSSPTIYTSFDTELGLGRLQDTFGNIFYGSAQTNGAVGKGESIRLRRGVLAKYDSMPRVNSVTKQASGTLKTGKLFVFYGGTKNSPADTFTPSYVIYSYIYFDSSNALIENIDNEILRINNPPQQYRYQDIDILLVSTPIPTSDIKIKQRTSADFLGLSNTDFFHTSSNPGEANTPIIKKVAKKILLKDELITFLGDTPPVSEIPRGIIGGKPYFISSRPGTAPIFELDLLVMRFQYKSIKWSGTKWIVH